ncbi:MAG TPA: hypothetical protein PKN24_08710 [bacterium]|nr:hypothetical protein [bacterium]
MGAPLKTKRELKTVPFSVSRAVLRKLKRWLIDGTSSDSFALPGPKVIALRLYFDSINRSHGEKVRKQSRFQHHSMVLKTDSRRKGQLLAISFLAF